MMTKISFLSDKGYIITSKYSVHLDCKKKNHGQLGVQSFCR